MSPTPTTPTITLRELALAVVLSTLAALALMTLMMGAQLASVLLEGDSATMAAPEPRPWVRQGRPVERHQLAGWKLAHGGMER